MMKPDFLQHLIDGEELLWFPERGIGWYPVKEQPYDSAYWQKYLKMDATPTGEALTKARIDLVRKYYSGHDIIDVGIGGGRFVREIDCKGFDVNPDAIDWLLSKKKWADAYITETDVMTFWDSLEHIHNPHPILKKIRKLAFVSCPVYRDGEHILRSKHFRKDEHCHYWTRKGLIDVMTHHGFDCLETNEVEVECGREDIMSFVFLRQPE